MQTKTFVNKQFAIYLFGGVLSALIDIGTLELLIMLKVAPLLSTSAGFIAGLLFNYLYHVRFTFNTTKSLQSMLRYMLLVGLNYLITLGLVYCSFYMLKIGVLPGKVVSLPIIAINGYLVGKHWVFKSGTSD